MECWCVSKRLLVLMTMLILMVWQTQGVCIEEERKALLEIKASLIDSYGIDHLPTWVDDGSTVGRSGECCDWELVTCNAITGHVTNLSLYKHVFSIRDSCKRIWPLNVSVFLHFKELTSLDLSGNCLDDGIVNTGLGRLSSLKKLETLDLSWNSITNAALPSLGALTSLRVLSLGSNKLEGYFPALALENLEILDLTNNFGTFGMQDFEKVSLFKKLKILKLTGNNFNKSQFITSLSALPLLKSLRLDLNRIHGSFPAEELAGLTSLEKLDLSWNSLNRTPNIQDCNKLSRLKRFESIDLGANYFNKSIISCLSALPSLKTLLLQRSYITFGSIFPTRELSSLKALETLDLSFNDLELPILNEMPHLPNLKVLLLDANNFNGTLPMEAFTSFHRLEVLDLGYNYFVGSIPSTIQALSSLRAVSFAVNNLNGSLLDHGLCELKNLHELDLSYNMFHGNLPQCFNNLSSLKVLDIASNQFTGTLVPSPIADLTSLEYVDFSHNKFEGSFLFSSLSNQTKLEVVRFICTNDKFEVETEEPSGWVPMFQLKVLVVSNCNMNRLTGNVVPGFLLHQHKLRVIDLSHNSLAGQFPNWLVENNTMLEALDLRNNSIGVICMPRFRNANTRWLDVSENHMNGTIPSDVHKFLPNIAYLNLSTNSLDGDIPSSIRDLSRLEVLDLSGNELSGEVSSGLLTNLSYISTLILSHNRLHGEVLSGKLSLGNIKRLHLDSNNFTGKIGKGTRQAPYLESLDISNNFFTGMIPRWISNSRYLSELVVRNNRLEGQFPCGIAPFSFLDISHNSFSGPIPSCLNLMMGLDLSCNRLTGEIPKELGLLNHIQCLNLSHNQLIGTIPIQFSNLAKIESLDLSSNALSGHVPAQLIKLNYLSMFNVSYNNLSGRLPEMKAQFGTFTKESYEGNPLLCGLPLEKKCTTTSEGTHTQEKEDIDKWHDIDMVSFYGSSGATWVVFLLGFVAVLYINPYWRRRWLDLVEECMFTCYYFLEDSVRKVSMVFRK